MNLSNVDGETPMDGVASTTAISPEELSHLIHEVKQSRFRNGDKCYVVPMEYWNSLVSSLNSGSLGTISEISCSSIISEDKSGYSLKSGLLVHTDIQTLPESVFIRLREAFGVENEDRDVIPVILDNDTVKPCMKEVPPITREELGALIKESEDHAMILGEKWYIIPKQWWNTVHTAYKNGFPEDIKQINCAKISTETLDGYFLKADLRESVDYIYLPQIVFDRFRRACGLAREQRDVIEREVVKRKDQLILQTYQRVVTVILARDSSVSCSILLTGEESMAYIRDAILRELNLTNIPLSALRFYITSSESSDSWELIDPTQENVDAYFDTAQKVCLDVNDENGWLINSKTKKVSLFGPQSQAAWWYMMYHAVCMLTNWRWLLSAATSLLFRLHSTNPYSSRSYGALPPKEQPVGQHIPGVCGLHNLGNTCFMASAMQCLSNVPPLTNYILSGEYKKDVNLDNPLGTHGELVAAYADLLHILWCGDNSAIHPRKLKATIGQFAPRFSGYAQQDSQELLAYVLDGLHEDLNRVKKKPYIQENESADQMEEHEKAAQSWKNYKIRNDSIIVDKFHGQLKSKLVCPVCSKVSIKFDPFCFLSVPLPPKDRLPKLTITVMYNSIPKKKWAKFTITMSSSTLAGDVCKYIKTQLQNDNDDSFQLVLFAAGINNDDVRILDMFEPVIFDDGPHELFAAQVTMTSGHKKYIVVKNQNTTGRVLSLPMIFSLKNNEEISETFIKEKVLRFISETYHTRGMRSDEEYKIMVTDGKDILPYPDGLSSTNSLVTLIFQWKEAALFNQYKGADLIERECALSTRKDIHLMDCIDIFTREEQLGEDDSWYCPNCKKHERATKKLDLWTLPEILIIHLKRFHYSRWNRDKIDTPVVIPVSGFELNDKIANEKHEHVKYDLIAISHHAGGLGGGHYTAAALNQHTGKWYDYNDSSAFEGTTPSNPCTSRTPYLLFYQRRTVVPDAAHTDSNFEMETD